MKTLEGPQSGACGDVVASKNHYGQHLRKKGHPEKRLTVARLQSDKAMRIVDEAWNNLTDEQRERWYVAGPSVPSRKVFGMAGRLDGRGFFFKTNLPRARLGQELLLEPPAPAGFGRNPAVAFTIINDKWDFAMELTLACAPAEEIMLWASPPCNAGNCQRQRCLSTSLTRRAGRPARFLWSLPPKGASIPTVNNGRRCPSITIRNK